MNLSELYKDVRHGLALGIRCKAGAAAGVICEDLPNDQCAFAISSSSKRCVLESYQHSGAPTEYKCRTSQVGVPKISNYIENDGCIIICGVDRNMVGISSDALVDVQFKDRLCSPECFQNCPSIIDLYYNLAAGEGVHLPDLCQAHQSEPHRAMAEIRSSGGAPGPRSAAGIKAAPGPRSAAGTKAAPGPGAKAAPGPGAKAAPGPGAKAAPGPVAGGKVSASSASPTAAPVAGAKGVVPASTPVAGAKASESEDSPASAAATSTQAEAGAGDDDDAGSTQDDDDDII